MAANLVVKLGARRRARRGGRLRRARGLPQRRPARPPGLYPVASVATAGLAFGLAEVAHGSGFLAVYLAALILGTGPMPARRRCSHSTRA